jgi:hypothetical protein
MDKLQDIIEGVLRESPETRGNEYILYMQVIKRCAEAKGKNQEIENMRLYDFLNDFTLLHEGYNIPYMDSVTRIRRKLVREYPELEAKNVIKQLRRGREQRFKRYARR